MFLHFSKIIRSVLTVLVYFPGCERYSSYTGYGDTFEWDGDYQDKTPRDSSGRLECSIVAIDALSFRVPNSQYLPQHISRELNKVTFLFLIEILN